MDVWKLLQLRAEPKPPIVDGYVFSPDHKLLVSISGGKDSTCAWALCENEFKNEVVPIFCNTGHEAEITYAYLGYLQRRMHSRLRFLERKMIDGSKRDWQEVEHLDCSRDVMLKLGLKKGRFPSSMAKFCTTILKLEPLRWWLDCQPDKDKYVMITGLRAEESPSRAKANPYVVEDEAFHIPRWHILFSWTKEMVFAAHKYYSVEPNPLYLEGFGRVGCFPCIYEKKAGLKAMVENHPEAINRVREYEQQVGRTFFFPGKTPDRYCSRQDPNGRKFPTIDDVARWAVGDDPDVHTTPISEEDDLEAPVCTNQYGLCG